MYLSANITEEDIKDCIDTIIEDNKFDRREFLKECGLMPNTKNIRIDHLVTICRHKGYELAVKLPEDRLSITYYLENQGLETETPLVNEIPVEFERDEDEDDSFPF